MAQPKGYAAFILFPHLKTIPHSPGEAVRLEQVGNLSRSEYKA